MRNFRSRLWALALPALLVLPLALPDRVAAQQLEPLRARLQARVSQHKGVVGVAIIDLTSGDTLSIRGDERFPTASLIKLPILVELFHQIDAGRIKWNDPLTLIAADKVPGAGMLQHFSTPHQLTIGDAATLMISVSDNTATNLLIDKVGIRGVNARMDTLGFRDTDLFAKVFLRARTTIDSAGSARWGLGATTPREMASILAQLHRGKLVSDSSARRIIDLLKLQTVRDRIPRLLPAGTVVAHKTGEVDDSKNDCGVVYAPNRPYVVCLFTRENSDRRWVADNEALVTGAELSRMIYDAIVSRR